MRRMKLAVVVHGAPASSQAARSALRFVEAALAAGHDIHRVFFYHDAVQTANVLVVAPQDELDVGARWSEIATRHGVELGVCVAAALRRGIVDAGEAERYERPAANLRPPFVILGLGQLVEAALESDRVVTFPA
jgi:tRNA 2-thiouridine synthesizing protein D